MASDGRLIFGVHRRSVATVVGTGYGRRYCVTESRV